MPIAYVDSNRGNDSTGDGSISKPYRTFANIQNWNAGGGGGILFARDSFFDVVQTISSSGALSLTSAFNGVSGNRCFIDAYDPPGVGALTSKPTFRARMLPVAGDWQWDSTLNFGVPKGWYIQFQRSTGFWDARVKVGGQYAETTNQNTTDNTGLGNINGTQIGPHAGTFVNGMTLNTLRFNLDYSGTSVGGQTGARLYLAGLGLNTSGAGNDPSSVLGPGNIEISFGTVFSLYDAGRYGYAANLRFVNGSGFLTYQGTNNTVKEGFEVFNIEHSDTCIPIRINSGTSVAASTRWAFNIHDCLSSDLTGPSFTAYGAGIAGEFHHNTFTDGNKASSMGGGVYMQINPSTLSGVPEPFVVHHNNAQRWKNGAGNNEFDGSCYYVDVNDNGTILHSNIAKDSFVAFQCGSGKKSEWYSNIAINCEQFAMFNNPTFLDTNDYTFANNLFVAAARGTFSHGDTADVHRYHMPMYHVGTVANLVNETVANNVFINHPANTSEVPLLACSDDRWQTGKVKVSNNLFIGYGAALVKSNFGSMDKTSVSASLPSSTSPSFKTVAGTDYAIGAESGLFSAGVDIKRSHYTDPAGRNFNSPPSVGPYEAKRMPDCFGIRKV